MYTAACEKSQAAFLMQAISEAASENNTPHFSPGLNRSGFLYAQKNLMEVKIWLN